MKSVGWFISCLCVITGMLYSCDKEDIRVKPDVRVVPEISVPDSFIKQVAISFEDEVNGAPLTGLRVQLYQGTRSFDQLTSKDGIVRFDQMDTRRPLWLPRPYLGIDSPYFMPNVLFVFPSAGSALLPPDNFQYRIECEPVFTSKDTVGFLVQVPRRATLEVNLVQDTLYLEKMIQNSRFRLYYSLYVIDSVNNHSGWVDGNFNDLPSDGTLLRSYRRLKIPADRRFRIDWQLVEEEVTSYFYDDGNYRTIREGSMMVDTVSHNRVNTISMRF